MAAKVVSMSTREEVDPTTPVVTPWGVLGFASERDMLLDDLRVLSDRIKSTATTATAVAALSKRKQEVFEQIKLLDSGAEEDEILDDADDEPWESEA